MTRPRALAAYVVIGIVIGVGVAVLQHRGAHSSAPQAITVRSEAIGTRGAAAAVWLFGTRTVRFPPTAIRSGTVLAIQGFGNVFGARGAVDLFDPQRGTLGRLDARRNRLEELPPVRVAPGAAASPQPIAESSGALWLVTGPAELTRVELTGARARTTVPLETANPTGVTLVWADAHHVWAAVSSARSVEVLSLDADTAQIDARTSVASRTAPVALTAVRGQLVVVFRRSTISIDEHDLTTGPARPVGGQRDVDLVGATSARGHLWVLDRGRATVMDLDPGTGTIQRSIRIQGPRGSLRGPNGIAGAPGSIWVVAPETRDRFGAVRATGIDAVSGRIHDRFVAPSALEVGAVAISTSVGRR